MGLFKPKGKVIDHPSPVAQLLGTSDQSEQVAAIQRLAAPTICLVITADWRGLNLQPVGCQVDVSQVEAILGEVIRQLRQQEREALKQAAQAGEPAAA